MERGLFGATHLAVKARVQEFLREEVIERLPQYRAERGFPPELWRAAGRRGLLGLRVPSEWGGAGRPDFLASIAAAEEYAKVSAALSSCIGMHASVCATYMVDLGTRWQKERWLPPLCTGELVCALAMTERHAGSDLTAIHTSAVRDGAHWVINGSKIFITNGGSAGLMIVAARTTAGSGPSGMTLFGVEADQPGFRRGEALAKIGQPESNTAELFFTDVRVPDTHRIGPLDGAFTAIMRHLVGERMSAAAANTAQAGQILQETIAYVKSRRAFGQSIGSFQHNSFKIAELVTKIDVTQAFVDRCLQAHAQGELGAADAAKAKWWSAQVQNDILDECLQLHGGHGYLLENRVAQAWADARVTKIWAGSNEIMKAIISRDLGLARDHDPTA